MELKMLVESEMITELSQDGKWVPIKEPTFLKLTL